MKRNRITGAILPFILSLMVLASCSGSKKQTEKELELPETENDLYVVVTLLSNLDYFEDYKKALESAETELGVSTAFLGPEDYDLETLINLMAELSDGGEVEGIILLGWEDALIPSINYAVEKGIYVCTVCQDLPESNRSLYIGMDNDAAGRQAAELLLQELPENAEIALLRGTSLTNVSERVRGVKSILDDYPDVIVAADVDTKNDKQIALEKVRKLFNDYPEIDGILAMDGISSYAVAETLKEYAEIRIPVICFDKEAEVLEGIEKGYISQTIVANTPLEVYLAIMEHQRLKYSELQLSLDDDSAGIQLKTSYIDPGCYVIDSENVSYFKK